MQTSQHYNLDTATPPQTPELILTIELRAQPGPSGLPKQALEVIESSFAPAPVR